MCIQDTGFWEAEDVWLALSAIVAFVIGMWMQKSKDNNKRQKQSVQLASIKKGDPLVETGGREQKYFRRRDFSVTNLFCCGCRSVNSCTVSKRYVQSQSLTESNESLLGQGSTLVQEQVHVDYRSAGWVDILLN